MHNLVILQASRPDTLRQATALTHQTYVSFKPPPSLLPTPPSLHTIFLLFHPHYLHHAIFSFFNLADITYIDLVPSQYLARPLTLPCMPNLVRPYSQRLNTHFAPAVCSGFLSHNLGVQCESNLNVTTSYFLTLPPQPLIPSGLPTSRPTHFV